MMEVYQVRKSFFFLENSNSDDDDAEEAHVNLK